MTAKEKKLLFESLNGMDLKALELKLAEVEEKDPDIEVLTEIKSRIEQAKDDKVTVVALKDTPIDGKVLAKGNQAKIRLQQYKALASRLQLVKSIALLFGLLFIGSTFSAHAQQYTLTTLTNISSIAAGTAVTGLNLKIPMTKWTDLALQFSWTNNATVANASNVVFACSRSLDSTTIETNTPSANPQIPSETYTLLGRTDTATSSLTTNRTVGAIGYYIINGISNGSSAAINQVTIKYNRSGSK